MKYEELTTRNRHSAAEHKCTENVCTEETVYRTYCVHTEHVVTSCEFYSLGYYNRFYLYTLVPAEIGELSTTNSNCCCRVTGSYVAVAARHSAARHSKVSEIN